MIKEEKREEIKREAKEILDRFISSLKGMELKEQKFKKEVSGFRVEGEGSNETTDFRERMFNNAPNKEGDSIIVERKKW